MSSSLTLSKLLIELSRMINKNKIKVVIWDVDGTLYQGDPAVGQVFEQSRQELLEKHWSRPYHLELKEVFKTFKQRHKSSTKTLSVMTGLDIKEITQYIETKLHLRRNLTKDPKLVNLFNQLSHLHHLVLRNGGHDETLNILKLLGLHQIKVNPEHELGPFFKVWGAVDDFHQTKPNLDVFDRVKLWIYKQFFWEKDQKITHQNINKVADRVLMVGDKPEVDLKPAKEVGFQTAWAWTDPKTVEKPDYVDICLPTVYDLADIINS